MSVDSFLLELQDSFLQEASDLLEKVEALSLDLEKDPKSQETYAQLARLAHNFKGSGKAVGFDHISKLAHRLEDYILAIKNGVILPLPAHLDFLFKCLDQLKGDIHRLIEDKTIPLDHTALLEEISARLTQPQDMAAPDAPPTPPQPPSSSLENLPEAALDLSPAGVASAPSEPKSKVAAPPSETGAAPAPLAEANKKASQEVLRIAKSKIDFLLEAFGEQVILQSALEQSKFDLLKNRDLILKTISQLTKLTFELQDHALSLTMVQLGPLFTKLERAIRDAARTCAKDVDVKLSGIETEVDKTLIDSLSDSLTHMVRNAVDHAIETSDVREAAGKPSRGTIEISARRTGAQLWIEVIDDGKGLDPKALTQKALSKGLIDQATADGLTPSQAFQLIFLNGFSTKEVVSEVSGRGVGMNVVSEAVTQLNGVIEILSEVGKGTTFRLKLPLSLSIFNGAVIRVNGSRFIVPNSEIAEIGRIQPEQQVQMGSQKAVIKIREEVFELIDLRRKLKNAQTSTATTDSEGRVLPLLITRKNGRKAYLIDEVIGIQKIVQKPLGEEVKNRPEYAAGTILGDGTPGVILNLNVLAQGA